MPLGWSCKDKIQKMITIIDMAGGNQAPMNSSIQSCVHLNAISNNMKTKQMSGLECNAS